MVLIVVQCAGTPDFEIPVLAAVRGGIAVDMVNQLAVQVDVRARLAAVDLAADDDLRAGEGQGERSAFPVVAVADEGLRALVCAAVVPKAPGTLFNNGCGFAVHRHIGVAVLCGCRGGRVCGAQDALRGCGRFRLHSKVRRRCHEFQCLGVIDAGVLHSQALRPQGPGFPGKWTPRP